jgi:hypothetical protein
MSQKLDISVLMVAVFKRIASASFLLCVASAFAAALIQMLELWGSPFSAYLYNTDNRWFPFLQMVCILTFITYRIFHFSIMRGNSTPLNILGFVYLLWLIPVFYLLPQSIGMGEANPPIKITEEDLRVFALDWLEVAGTAFPLLYLILELIFQLKRPWNKPEIKEKLQSEPRFFSRRYLVTAISGCVLLLLAAGIGHQMAKKDTAFINLYLSLKTEPKLDAIKAKMVNNASTKSFADLTNDLKQSIGDEFDIIFLMTHGTYGAMLDLSSPKDTETLSQKTLHFIPEKLGDMWKEFRTSSRPWVMARFPVAKMKGIPVAGFMRFKTAHGDLIAMVQSKPAFIKFNFPVAYP